MGLMTLSFPYAEINKQYKYFFTMQLFLFVYIPNIIADVFWTENAFLYTINGIHEESMSHPNGR